MNAMRAWTFGCLVVLGVAAGACRSVATPLAVERASLQADVCVYGATSAGVVAAVTARGLGLTVVLLAGDGWVGGLTTSGLGATDVGNKDAIGGIARSFYRRLRAHYDDPAAWTHGRREDFRGRGRKKLRLKPFVIPNDHTLFCQARLVHEPGKPLCTAAHIVKGVIIGDAAAPPIRAKFNISHMSSQ